VAEGQRLRGEVVEISSTDYALPVPIAVPRPLVAQRWWLQLQLLKSLIQRRANVVVSGRLHGSRRCTRAADTQHTLYWP
jgi:hypothetical protein